jgi:hypothetical protein
VGPERACVFWPFSAKLLPTPTDSYAVRYVALFLPLISWARLRARIPAPGSFASSAFPVPPQKSSGPSRNAVARLGSSSPRLGVPQENGAKKGERHVPQFRNHRLDSSEPIPHRAKLRATARSSLCSRSPRSAHGKTPKTIGCRRPSGTVEGGLISSIYECPGKGKKDAATKITSWSIRADAVRRLDRGEPEPEAITPRSTASEEAPETSGEASY